jgi:hypothetical protein
MRGRGSVPTRKVPLAAIDSIRHESSDDHPQFTNRNQQSVHCVQLLQGRHGGGATLDYLWIASSPEVARLALRGRAVKSLRFAPSRGAGLAPFDRGAMHSALLMGVLLAEAIRGVRRGHKGPKGGVPAAKWSRRSLSGGLTPQAQDLRGRGQDGAAQTSAAGDKAIAAATNMRMPFRGRRGWNG